MQETITQATPDAIQAALDSCPQGFEGFLVSGLAPIPEEWEQQYEYPHLYSLGSEFHRQEVGTGLWLGTWPLGLQLTDIMDGMEYIVTEQPRVSRKQQHQMLVSVSGNGSGHGLEWHPRGNGGLRRTR